MNSNKKLTNYVSEIDRTLQEFDQQCPEKSLSQLLEIAKSERISKLRDNKEYEEEPNKLWEGF